MRKPTALLLLPVLTLAGARRAPEPDPQIYLEHVKVLAAESMRGRGTGSPELEKAAGYIARQFKKLGLQPIDGKSYFQAFNVTTNAKLGAENRFEYADGLKSIALKFPDEFTPFNFSSRAKLSGSVVFAGYGITARELNYDDYAGLDVKDKLVLVLRHEPQEFDDKSVFNGKVYTEHSQFFSKATNAKNHGARGVILINDRANHRGEAEKLEPFSKVVGPNDAGIPFVQVAAEIADRWFSGAGKSVDAIMTEIDQDLKPRSFPLPAAIRIEASVDVERAVKTVHNVAGYLPGESAEHLVIGAHYDHLGLGEQFSMAPSMAGTPHPGADDNASGTAGVLELARYFTSLPKPKRGILFLCFAGEELGLLGSSYYVNHPTFSLDKAVAMINMDMIGRMRDGKVYIGGVGSGNTLKSLLDGILPRYDKLKVDFSETAGYGSSDHTSFTTKQVPVLFFFSGLHADYHKPSDTWDKIDGASAAGLLKLVADVGTHLIETGERPLFVRVKPPAGAHEAVAGSAGAVSGYGANFGSIPDFTEIPNGVRFADIKEGSPAAVAGLKAGDILTEFDGKPINNLYDFTYALRTHKPGEEVLVRVLRGTQEIRAKVLLGQRK
ncbi:MAG: M28 family peptidase [Acidobacteria bacterium]|nr:M28 family peptidase [Acidobacteriota bacterium]MBI3470260.1 M28 family peptidase [Candidatus Solibacter usitatus]